MWNKIMKAFGLGKPPKNGAVPHTAAPAPVVEEEEYDDAVLEITQEMLKDKFDRAMQAAEAHAASSKHLCDVTSAGGLNVVDVLAAKKKAGIG